MMIDSPPLKVGLALCLGLLICASAAPTAAQRSQGAEHDRATALLREGLSLRQQGEDERALSLFEEAYRIEGSTVAQAQVALAEAALGRWLAAHTHLSEALSHEGDEWIRSNGEALREALSTMEEHLGQLRLAGGEAGARVLLNGDERGTLPLSEPLWVLAGTVVLEVRADGFHPLQREIQVPAGGTAREEIRLVAAIEGGGGPQGGGQQGGGQQGGGQQGPEGPASGGPDLIGPIVLYGVAAASLGASLGLGLAAVGSLGGCGDNDENPCAPAVVDGARPLAGGADLALAVGAGAVVGATIWLIVELTSGGGAPPSDQASLGPQLTPWVSDRAGGLTFRMRL